MILKPFQDQNLVGVWVHVFINYNSGRTKPPTLPILFLPTTLGKEGICGGVVSTNSNVIKNKAISSFFPTSTMK